MIIQQLTTETRLCYGTPHANTQLYKLFSNFTIKINSTLLKGENQCQSSFYLSHEQVEAIMTNRKWPKKKRLAQLFGRLHFCKGRTVFVGNGILLAYMRDTEIGLWICFPNREDHDSEIGPLWFWRAIWFIDFSWGQVLEDRCKEGFFLIVA